MKKFLIILALMASMPLLAEHVDPETARKVAATFLGNNGAKADQLTDLSKAAGFPNLYIFNGEEGFVVMAADDCVQPILGYSLTGKFVTEGMPENVSSWLQGYSDEIQFAIENRIKASSETAQRWKDLSEGKPNAAKTTVEVAPLVQTLWDQDSPFNGSCPTGTVTGCVATAMAQIMKYWDYPTRGIGSHSYQYSNYGTISADFGATDYDWAQITNTYSNTSTLEQQTAVSTLMYHCGVSVEMQYGPESASNTKRSSIAMNTYFNYNTSYLLKKDYSETKWSDTLKYELNQGRPILYSGSGNGSHAFVCDGYNSNGEFHFNWGWRGKSNGYFAINSLTPGSFDFSTKQYGVIGIHPLTDKITPITLENSLTTLSWTDSQNCDSYNIYRNNALIATTTEAAYTDPNPSYGTNKYYVRGLSGNVLTQPSNYAIVTIDYPTPVVNGLHANLSENELTMSWDASDWCFPSTANAETFAYVDEKRFEQDAYFSWGEGDFILSWGHRYPAENLTNYDGKAIHEISFFSMYPGAFDVVVYQGTEDNHPVEEIVRESISTAKIGWSRVRFNMPAIIDSNRDLWIFVINTDCKVHSIYHKTISHNNGSYYSGNDPTQIWGQLNDNTVWLIHAYLTDGTYTYNLYQDGVKIAEDLTETSYSNVSLNNNSTNQFVVKTNFYGGETEASNSVGFAKGNTSIEDLILGDNDKMTILENSTFTVSKTLENTNPANLVLEDGAKLITSSEDVEATVKKNINDWNTTSWYFIASPLTGTTYYSGDGNSVTGLITDGYVGNEASVENATFDLYYLDITATPYIWKNYRKSQFNLTNGTGYLYANKDGTSLEFSGTIPSCGTAITTDNLNEGFNLVGNPYTCDAYVNQAYYTLSQVNEGISNSTTATLNTVAIPPCTGIIVQSVANGSVTFSKDAPAASTNKGNLQMALAQTVATRGDSNAVTIDNAIVSFSEGTELGKYYFSQQNANIYIPQDDEEFAIAYSQGQGMVPVCFKAKEDGEYTITVTPEEVEMSYLLLIDNITGQEVDLMATPSYTFNATTYDYASRFKLVFSAKSNNSEAVDESFAFISDGQIIVTDVYDNATLQVIDMAGRVVVSVEGRTRCVPTTGMKTGVYVLQIITENETKTQKIIIK